MVYLFIGQDQFSKGIQLEKIKRELFLKEFDVFNFDSLHAPELNLRNLQEILLRLPVRAKKRVVLIKEAQSFKEPLKEFLLSYLKKPYAHLLLVLDAERADGKNEFLNKISRYARIFRFKEKEQINTFTLSREINNKRINSGLRVLRQLLLEGTDPQRIMGGLRYSWENGYLSPLEKRKRLLGLLKCDIEIKTGRLKPELALERFLINLCCLQK